MSDDGTFVDDSSQQYPSRLFTNDDFTQASPAEQQQPVNARAYYNSQGMAYNPSGGSAPSSYDNNFTPLDMGNIGSGSGPFSTPVSRGTPPMPSRSGGFSGPNLPAPQQARLNQLLTDPNAAIAGDKSFQFLQDQGEQALARTAAAKKMTLSGQSLTDALKFGQGNAMQYLNQLIQQLLGASNASRVTMNGGVGPDPGTQGEYAARDLIPVIQRMMAGSGRPSPTIPPTASGYGGMTPRLQSALDPRAETDQYLANNPDYEFVPS